MALIQLTTAGVALIDAATGPVVVDSFQLGSAFNYTPEPTDIALHGTTVYSGTPTTPLAINANIVKYSIFVDYPIGPFQFGEFGIYVGATLFALGTTAELVQKLALTSLTPGNAIRIDMYLSMVGTNYAMWLDLNQSNNDLRIGVLQSPDYLPPSSGAVPNVYVVQGVNSSQSAFLAYTDTNGLWNFDTYDYAGQTSPATITAADNRSVTIAIADYVAEMTPAYLGQVLLQFSTGELFGIARYVSSAITSGNTVTFGFDTPLAIIPDVGDKFIVFVRNIGSTTIVNIPIATTTVLGGIIVGPTLTVTASGVLNVSPSAYPVTSVNGQAGVVDLTASDIPGLAKVATTGEYSDLLNIPPGFALQPATTVVLGGVKAPSVSEGHLVIASDGTIDLAFNPVKSVNGVNPDPSTGNVVLPIPPTPIGLVNPTAVGNNTDLNSETTTGLFFISAVALPTILNIPGVVQTEATLEVLPFNTAGFGGDVIQRLTTSTQMFFRGLTGSTWGPWYELAPLLTHNEQSILATSVGQTTFVTTGYPVGYIEVFIAGTRIQPTVDYAATDGINITISNAALAAQIQIGAVLTVSSFPIFSIASAVTYPVLAASTGATLVGYGATTVNNFLNEIANGGATPAGPLTGAEIVNVSRGAGLLDTTTGAIAALALEGAVVSFNTRTGAVTLTLADVTGVGGAPINSPNFTGVPTAPTPAPGNNSTDIATTAFIYGNFAPINSPTFTGNPQAPTPPPGDNDGSIATTAFVQAALGSGSVTSFNTRTGAVTLTIADVTGVGGAPIANPTFTGIPSAPTAITGTNTTQLATTAFVAAAKYYDIAGGVPGALTTAQLLSLNVAARALSFPANLAGSRGIALTAPTNSFVCIIAVNGVTVGSMTFAAGATVASFSTLAGAFTVSAGQYITVTAPVAVDLTLANMAFTLLSLAT